MTIETRSGHHGGQQPKNQGNPRKGDQDRGWRRRRARAYRPGGFAFEVLEERRLLDGSNDLTQQIDNLLTGGTTSGSVDLPNVMLGSFFSSDKVTVSFQDVSQQGSNWSGTVTVTADTAALTLGSELTGQIKGDAQNSVGLTGTYTLHNQPLDQGEYALTVTELDVSVPHVLTGTAGGVTLKYDASPNAPAGQTLAQVGSLKATFSALDDATATLDNLTILDNGFTLGNGSVTASTLNIGTTLTVAAPTLTFKDAGYTVGSAPTGTLELSSDSVTLFPGQSAFSATVDGFSAAYDFTNNVAKVSATDALLTFGASSDPNGQADVTLKASGLGFAIDASGGGLSADVTIGSAEVMVPRFHLDGSVTGLVINNDGFSIATGTAEYQGTISLGSVFTVTDPSLTFDKFGYSVANGPKFGGLKIEAGEIDLATKPSITATARDVSGSIDFATHDFTFGAGTVTATLGSYLTLQGSGIQFDTAPAAGGDIASIGSIGATLKLPGNGSLTGNVTDLAIAADGTLTSTPGGQLSGSLDVNDASSLKWPTWLPIQVTHLGIAWPDFAANPTDFTLDLSAAVNASIPGTTVTLSGKVTDAQIDTGLLESNQFPITGLGGASISVGGSLFGASVTGTLFVAVLNVDGQGNVVPDGNPNHVSVANHYLYGGIEGGIDLEGLAGLELRLGVSQFGLLDGFVDVTAPIILDPETGLAITNLHAGIEFGQTLPSITDAHLLNPANAVKSTTGQDLSALTPPGQQTAAQWEEGLMTATANVARGIAQGQDPTKVLYSSFVINAGATLYDAYASENAFRLDGDVLIDTTGKLEVLGALTVGDSVSLKGAAYLDLSQVASGQAHLLLYAQGPSQAPIVTAYGNLDFQYNGPKSVTPPSNAPDLGTGLSLNGTTDDATANNINLNNTSYTVEFWARRADTGRTEYVIGQADASTANDLQIGFDAHNNFFVTQNGQTLDDATTDGNWHHWAVTFDQSTGTRTIYLDGKPVASDTAGALQNTSTTLLISRSGSTYFDGSVDEVRVWSVARSAADVLANATLTAPATTAGLLADWSFNEGQGTIASDSSGRGNTATLEGNPTWALTLTSPPAADSFASFTLTIGGEVDLTVPDLPAELQITGSAAFTVTPGQKSLDLTVSGHAPIPDLGLEVGVAGNVHFDVSPSNTPELYGILQVQVKDLDQLRQLGINVDGTAVLEFNTTGTIVTGSFQLPDDTTPTTYNYTLPAQSASLSITGEADIQEAGQTWFSLNGELYAFFGLSKDSQGNLDPLLQFYIGANLLVGPSSSPIVEFQADGFLQVSAAGIASAITVGLEPTPLLKQAGIDLTGNTFDLDLNTTGSEVTFTVPQLSVPAQAGTGQPGSGSLSGTVPGAGDSVDIPAAPSGVNTPEPYLSLVGNANVNIEDAFLLNSHLTLLVVPGTIDLQLDSLNYTLQVGSTVLEQFTGQGGLIILDGDPNNVRFAAALQLQQSSPFSSSEGFGLNASFALDANTTGQAQALGGIIVPALDSRGNTQYAYVEAQGDLTLGGFDLKGAFDFAYSSGAGGTTAQILVAAKASLGPLGSAQVFGNLNIQTASPAGVYGVLEASLQGSPTLPVAVNANLELEVNTTGANQGVSTIVNGQVVGFTVNTSTGATSPAPTLTLPAGDTFTLVAGGTLTIEGLFHLQGEFDFTASTTGLNINAHADLTGFFGANLSLTTGISILYPTSAGPGGLVVNAALHLDTGSLGVGLFSIAATPTLMINTTGGTVNGVAPDTYEVALNNASFNLLGFQASGTVVVGVSDGVFEIDVPQSNPLTVSFFGLGGLQAYGYIKSNGQFSLTGSIGFQLGQGGNELYGSITATISNSGFSGSFAGGATVFGINLFSVSGWLSIQDGYVDLGAWVSVIGIGFGFNFQLGQLSPPPITSPTIYFYGVPTTANEGAPITLGAGALLGGGSTPADGDYQWSITRNGQPFASGSGANYPLTLGEPGTYTVNLSVDGLSRSSTLQVNDVAPTIQGTGLQSGYTVYNPGQPLTFTPSVLTVIPADVPNGLSYTWTVTDETTSSPTTRTYGGTTLTFTPDAPGSTPSVYKVTLTVADAYGGSTTATTTTAFFNPANIVVNTTQDQANAFTQNGVNYFPLREALTAALNTTGANGNTLPIVKFDPSLAGETIQLSIAGDTADHGSSAFAVPAGRYVELDGSVAPGVTLAVAPGSSMRLFYVGQAGNLVLNDLNLTGGVASGLGGNANGGAVYADGQVNFIGTAVYGNKAFGALQFGGNYLTSQAVAEGGAVYVSSTGLLYASESTFANNLAAGAPALSVYGYYYSYQSGQAVLTLGNYYTPGGSAYGGAIYSAAPAFINATTIAGNSLIAGSGDAANPLGAGWYDGVASSTFPNGTPERFFDYSNIIAQNTGGVDVYIANNADPFGSNNLIGTASNPPASFIATSANPLLGPLADHGNGVKTFSLLPGSPAIGAGNGTPLYLPIDGRGYPHQVNSTGNVYDIGAFQSQPYVVSNTNDSGPGSLRAAASEDDNGAPIVFAPGLGGMKITLTSGPIVINNNNVTVTGPGADRLTVAAAPLAATAEWTGNGTLAVSTGATAEALSPGAAPAAYAAGPFAGTQALKFSGNGALTAADNGALDSPAFTIGGWFDLTKAPGAGSEYYLASKYGGNFNGWILRVNSALTPTLSLHQSSAAVLHVSSSVPLTLNKWYYLAASYDGTTLRLFVNGAQTGIGTLAGGYTPSPSGSSNGPNPAGLTLGGASWTSGGYATANIADFSYFNTPLDPSLIAGLAQPTPTASRVFTVNAGASAVISGLTIADGFAEQGGGVYNAGTLALSNDELTLNSAQGLVNAAGVADAGAGGAVYNAPGAYLTVSGTTFAFNSAAGASLATAAGGAGRGGAIDNAAGAVLVAYNDTFAANTAAGGSGKTAGAAFGGAIDNAGTAAVIDATIANGMLSNGTGAAPAAHSDGIGIENEAGASLTLDNTIVAHLAPPPSTTLVGQDVGNAGTVAGSGNLVMSNDGLPAGTIAVTADPDLGPFGTNGGTTLTFAPRVGSLAIDAGSNAALAASLPPFPGSTHVWTGNGNVLDSTGGQNGALVGGTSYAPGINGQAFNLNGGGYVVLPTGADITGTGAFTVSAWIKTSSDGVIINQRDANNYNGEYQLSVQNGKVAWMTFGDNQYGFNFSSNRPVNDNNWHLVTAVRLSNGTGQIYVDGALDNSQAAPSRTLGSGFIVYIGADVRNLNYGLSPLYFKGEIEQVGLYTTALGAAQVAALYQGTAVNASTDQRGFARVNSARVDVGAVEAQPFVVSNTNDSGPGSLRAAITGDLLGDQPILFAPALNGQTITLTSGPIVISHDLTLNGPGAGLLTVSGGNAVQDFVVDAGNVTITGLTIANGIAPQGGGLYNGANLTLANDVFTGDTAENDPAAAVPSAQGGAIFNAQGATLNVTGSTFTNDDAIGLGTPTANPLGQGGAIFNAGPTLNAAGVVSAAGGVLSATDNTFNGNAAQQERRTYGSDGYDVVSDRQVLPSYATLSFSFDGVYTWPGTTNDPRVLQKAEAGATDRLASTEYSAFPNTPLDVNVNLQDGKPHTVSLYLLDYDSTARSVQISVLNGANGQKLDTRTVSSFHNGVYLSWVLQGNISIQIQTLSGANAVVSGVFFDPAPAGTTGPASFLGVDSITKGDWKYSPAGTGLGGAIDNEGTATLLSDTIDGNGVSSNPAGHSDGAGVENGPLASLTIYNTIVANDNGGHDLANLGAVTGDRNLVTTGSGVPATVVAVAADPRLGPLQNNGGPTPTMALLAGSPAIDGGDIAFVPPTDQRGLPRVAGAGADIGAYEYATPIVVTNTNDSGPGSLRAALGLVTTYPGSPISFAPSLAGQTIKLAGELSITSGVTIDGSTAPGLVIQGNGLQATNGTSRDVYVAPGVTASIRNLTLTGGFADRGGALFNDGTLTLQDVTVDVNVAYSAGGGLYNTGSLTVIDSTIANNTLSLAPGGTGLYLGGGIDNTGTLTLEGDTIAGNSAGAGGGVANAAGTATLHDTILYGNTAAGVGPDLDVAGGAVSSLGHNLLGTVAGSFATTATDLTGVNPRLGPLQNNGGPTPTLALSAGSPAIDAGDPMNAPPTDQRGFLRSSGNGPDIGAYERQPFVVTSVNATGPGSITQILAEDHDGSTITFAPALAGKTILLGGTVPTSVAGQTQVVGGRLLINSSVTIDGSTAPGLVLSGGNAVGVIEIAAGADVTLSDLSVEDGRAATGGGILVDLGGTLTLYATTVADNSATGSGGGVENQGTLNLSLSTVANNTAAGNGGGIDSSGTVTLQDATLGHNTAQAGGGLFMEGGTVTSRNTIIGDNNATIDPDLSAALTSLGYNMIGNGQGVSGTVSTDMVGVDPQLGPLQNNGGPTDTLAPAPTSAAVDGGSPDGAPTTDQRGLSRVAGLAIDVGSLESQYVPPEASPGGGDTGYLIRAGDSLTLDASRSFDPEGLPLTYSWDLNGDGVFGDAKGVSPTLTWTQLEALGITPSVTPYHVRVEVTDGYAADSYAVTSGIANLVVLPGLNIVSLTATSGGDVNAPVNSATVTFSGPIDPATITASDLSLTLNGGPNLITGPVQVQPIAGTLNAYQITGLSALTQAQGHYTLTLDAAGVAAADGSGTGNGSTSVSWLLDTTIPDSNVAPLAVVQTGTSFAVTAVGDDPSAPGTPGSGLVACDLYVSTNGGPYVYWTTVHPWSPTATFQGQQDSTYAFYSIGHDAAGNHEPPQPGQATTFVPDLTTPVSHVTAVDTKSSTFQVAFTGSDSGGSGLARIDVYVQVDGGPARRIADVSASSGTVAYQAIVDGRTHTYRFYSVGTDHAGNVQPAPTDPMSDLVVSASFVRDHTPPATHVTAVDARTSTFRVFYTGTDSGGSGLAHVDLYVQVDGGPARRFAEVNPSSGVVGYRAIVDGRTHTYRFFSVGVDHAGNAELAPANRKSDVVVTASFRPPVPLQATGLTVQKGAAERSSIRDVDLHFNESGGLAGLVAGNHVHLVKHGLDGRGSTPISLAGALHVVDQAIELDFGPRGLGGNPNSVAGDGLYEIDVDGQSKRFFFDRLLGDVNGDGVVNSQDVRLVKQSLGKQGAGLAADANGDGRVTPQDLAIAVHSLGRKLGTPLSGTHATSVGTMPAIVAGVPHPSATRVATLVRGTFGASSR